VTDELRAFITHVDTAVVATASSDGQPYIQHRGGAKGFIRALDDQTLAFVDFAGNRQYITKGNLSENNRICLFLIDYARRRRVKVWGTARMVPASDELLDQLLPRNYRARPEQIVLVSVDTWDVNCPQHIPQKLDATDVARAVERLEKRVAELERENHQLRSHKEIAS
jgi:hypothetical protein